MSITLSYTLSDAQGAEAIDAFCARYGYTSMVPDPNVQGGTIPNPETRAQFAKRQVAEWMKSEVLKYRDYVASQSVDKTPPTIT